MKTIIKYKGLEITISMKGNDGEGKNSYNEGDTPSPPVRSDLQASAKDEQIIEERINEAKQIIKGER